MAGWIVSVPVWGASYVATFLASALPALHIAAQRLREPVRFIIHTDQPRGIHAHMSSDKVEFRSVPEAQTYVTLQRSHADAVAAAAPGERVVLLNADLVVSGNLLLRCAEHFDAGNLAVVLLGIRTAAGPELPPAGATPRDLLAWAWQHRHQIIQDLEWPHGGSMLPTNLFWQAGTSVVARGFHLHPVAIVKQASTHFQSTIDGDLLDCFPQEEIHVVVDPDDCALCEISPPERRFPVRPGALTPARVAASMLSRASPMHRWLFTHRIVVCGTGAEVTDDAETARQILMVLQENTPPPAALPRRHRR